MEKQTRKTVAILNSICKRLLTIPNEYFDPVHWLYEGSDGNKYGNVIGHCYDLIPRIHMRQNGLSARNSHPVLSGDFKGLAAISTALHISQEDAFYLFGWQSYESTKRSKYHFIQRIRKYAKELEKDGNRRHS